MDSLIESPEPHLPKMPVIDYLHETMAAQPRPRRSVEKHPQWCAPLQTAPTAPTPSKERGSAGGKAANRGESRLIEIAIKFLEEEKNPKKCNNVSHLYYEYEALFLRTWTEYKTELEEAIKNSQPEITYGQTLKPDGMLRKLYQWVKKPDFRARLVELGYLEK